MEKRIGHYDVGGLLGKGGMGEVYRARDTTLDRDVALKLLHAELVGDDDRLARLRREAKVLASLRHQNIAAIYGIEESGGSPVLVMELAEGEDLSERLAAGPLPADEAEKIARQLARGLEVAHEQGIVHRDLKPANIKVAPDGSVKILDFGLARAFSVDSMSGVREPASDMPTMTQPLTNAGAVLGTTAYMSPEQARGYEVDRRSDIWAFGVILHEMLTGLRLFEGQTNSDVMAAVLRQEPDWEALAKDAPPHLVQICRRCLVKDPRQRLRDIGEARIALGGGDNSFIGTAAAPAAAATPSAPAGSNRKAWLAAAALGLLLVAATGLGVTGMIGPRPEPAPLLQVNVAAPDDVGFYMNPTSPGPVTVSPHGDMLAFTGQDSTGQSLLYVRRLNQPEAKAIAGTQDAAYPFWSPDGRSLGFFSSNELRRVDAAGGPVLTVCKGDNPKGGSWNEAGEIVFAPSHATTIHIVSADGGAPKPVSTFNTEKMDRSHRFPVWLPDGRHFLYLAVTRETNTSIDEFSELRLKSIDDGTEKVLSRCQTNAAYADGHIVYVFDNILMARPFSLQDLDFTGPAVPLTDGVMTIPGAHLGVFSLSAEGLLVFAPAGRALNQVDMQWLSLDGQLRDLDPDAQTSLGFDVSPSGEHVVIATLDAVRGSADLWLLEIARDLRTRLTFALEVESWPIWSDDGRWIAYSGDGGNRAQIYRQPASGIGSPEQLTDSTVDLYPSSWSPDGRRIACASVDSTGNVDIVILDVADGGITPFRTNEYTNSHPSFSPDGRWLAYHSNETGDSEVFVESLEPGAGRWRVSSNGGYSPLWTPDGKHIAYLTTTGRVLVTDITEIDGGLRFGETAELDTGVYVDAIRNFAVNRATGELLVVHDAAQNNNDVLKLVTHWQRLLER